MSAKSMNRRHFIGRSLLAGAGLSASSWLRAAGAGERIRVGVMGTSRSNGGGPGRGAGLAATMAGLPGAEVAYVCDVDDRNVPKAIAEVAAKQSHAPEGVRDFRKVLDDPSVDALVIATPDHWHAPAAILACAAGKHVYVEKPCSHNAHEGELLVTAARNHKKAVQHGTQRRSWPGIIEGMQRLHEGAIGRILDVQCWYHAGRPSIGRGKQVPAPSWLDWSLWQGPAPERDFRDNFVHYNWHWFWHWGTAELGNNGVHYLDLARWGAGVDFPSRVTCSGGKYRHDDDQETPDTTTATFDFGHCLITWRQRSWAERNKLDTDVEMLFSGEKGSLAIRGSGYTLYDLGGKETGKGSGNGGDAVHLQNFLDAIRGKTKLNAEIEEGYKSALLCHLGNIAWRTTGAAQFDPKARRLVGGREAAALWGREYRKGWEPKV
jgi:predicted dehydrogenase